MLAIAVLAATTCASCLTTGRHFPVSAVERIQVGKTTQEQVRTMFGKPWRTGVDSGKTTWTYAHYRYSMFGENLLRDLVIRFDGHGLVDSYSFNSTDPADQAEVAPGNL